MTEVNDLGVTPALQAQIDALAKDHDENYVTITKKEYESLLDDSNWRQCLEGGGVDNWSYYYDSLK